MIAESLDWFWALASLPFAFLWCVLLCVIVVQVRKYLCHRHDLSFKRDLIDQGYEPAEIAQMIAATPFGQRPEK
jgi:hypothetical protein